MVSVSGDRALALPVSLALLAIVFSILAGVASAEESSEEPLQVGITHELPEDGPVEPGLYGFRAMVPDTSGSGVCLRWFFDGLEVTRGEDLEAYLSPGNHTILLEAFDGSNTSWSTINVTVAPVRQTRSSTDIFLYLSLGSAAIVAVALLSFVFYVVFDLIRSSGVMTEVEETGKGPTGKIAGEGLSCDICLRPVTGEGRNIECRCGALFHGSCGKREGVCPECGREIMV